jgi:DNA (cytosine-5)-methyltransferase 1
VTVTATDLFCGAGGSSLGAEVAGVRLVMAANHWQTAIDVHQTHFPDAGHDCADISQADPRRYPVTDILLASPECTNHSQARGVSRKRQDPSLWDAPDPAAERSRATMWDVVRFAEQIRYAAVVVENVVEATKWVLWPAWWQAMESLGYRGQVVSANSMHHTVPQSRDRIYVVWVRRGLRPNLEQELDAWCTRCDLNRTVRQAWKPDRTVGRYRQQWVWCCTTCGTVCEPVTEPAAKIIDWALPCPRIGDRTRPLAPATRARILAGLERHGWVPVTTSGAGNVHERTPGNRARPVSEPVATQQTTSTTAVATPPGFLFQTAHGGRTTQLDRPHPTVCATDDRQALVVPMRRNGHAASTGEPVPTVTAGGNHHALLMRNNNSGGHGTEARFTTPVTEPVRTVTTAGHQSLLVPYYGRGTVQTVQLPVPTVPTRDRFALLDPDEIVDDCGFRMLEPYEVAAAMAFPTGYIPTSLPKKDQVKLAGNAVTPPVMAWVVGRILQALETAA